MKKFLVSFIVALCAFLSTYGVAFADVIDPPVTSNSTRAIIIVGVGVVVVAAAAVTVLVVTQKKKKDK